jgi:SP family arabinose:H+ symporter-like MFS transporter
VAQFTPVLRDGIGAAKQIWWLPEAIGAKIPPVCFEGIGPAGMFLLFAAILVPQIFMVWKIMPETAGRSLEEIERTYYDKP